MLTRPHSVAQAGPIYNPASASQDGITSMATMLGPSVL